MEDVESGSREELRLRIPQRALERRVHALEVAVEADDAQQVDREVEELLQLGPGLRRVREPVHVDALLPFPAIMPQDAGLTVPHRHATGPERRRAASGIPGSARP